MDYVHGYSAKEGIRLSDQAGALADLLHAGTRYEPGSRVLEAGCGTGAQTVILAGHSPEAKFTSVDVSKRSLAQAARRVRLADCMNVELLQADIFDLPFEPSCFDHAFVCFVLEHLNDPARALDALMTVLRPGGSLTVIEGDHGSAYFHPTSDQAQRAIQCLIDLQQQAGGDSLIGRRLYPLLTRVGYRGRCSELVSGNPRSAAGCPRRRNLLLHLLQGCGLALSAIVRHSLTYGLRGC
jgi:SAM-dependent methyltransferase